MYMELNPSSLLASVVLLDISVVKFRVFCVIFLEILALASGITLFVPSLILEEV